MIIFYRFKLWVMRLLHPDQAWFWTERWQRMEREADEDLAAGRYETFDMIEDLDSLDD